MTKRHKKPKVSYYGRFLERDTINEKEYLFFRKIWKKLDQEDNVVRHKKSVVKKIMRKYLKGGGLISDAV